MPACTQTRAGCGGPHGLVQQHANGSNRHLTTANFLRDFETHVCLPLLLCSLLCACRAMRRSESMHRRMVGLVAAAKMRTQTNQKSQELVGIR